jgi:hypothetical protein
MSVAFPVFEAAFVQAFSNKTIETLDGRVAEVPVFLEYPDVEVYKDQRYPSIAVSLLGLDPATETFENLPNTVVEVDYSVDPPRRVTRRAPTWYNVRYEVCTYTLSAYEDRELLRWVEGRFAPRYYIDVGEGSYHVFRDAFNVHDRVDIDTVIYEKSWEFTILVDIEDFDRDQESRAVKQINIASSVVRTTTKVVEPTSQQTANMLYNVPKSADSAADADKVNHRTLHFNDQGYWFDPKQ